jgi:hypothetical protein
MRQAGGVILCTDVYGTTEMDTFTCASCNNIIIVRPGAKAEELGGLDWYTGKLICAPCVDGDRSPFEEKLKKQEAQYHALRSYGF